MKIMGKIMARVLALVICASFAHNTFAAQAVGEGIGAAARGYDRDRRRAYNRMISSAKENITKINEELEQALAQPGLSELQREDLKAIAREQKQQPFTEIAKAQRKLDQFRDADTRPDVAVFEFVEGMFAGEDPEERTARIQAEAKAKAEAENIKRKAMYEGMFGLERVKQMLGFAKDPKSMGVFTAAAIATIVLGKMGWEGAKFSKKMLEAKFLVPKLVTETSIGKWGKRKPLPKSKMHLFVASDKLKADIQTIIDQVKGAKAKNASLGHALFYGEPGTGKTMMAREISAQTGMHYAIFAAGRLQALTPRQRSDQLQDLERWGRELGKKGEKLIIFMDEAEWAIQDAELPETTPEQRAVSVTIQDILKGQRDEDFMFIFVTNYPGKVEGAIMNRMNYFVNFPLPTQKERYQMFKNFMDENIFAKGISIEPEVASRFADEYSADAQTAGFSGRIIASLVETLADVGRQYGEITYEDGKIALDRKVLQEKFKLKLKRMKEKRKGGKTYVTEETLTAAGG